MKWLYDVAIGRAVNSDLFLSFLFFYDIFSVVGQGRIIFKPKVSLLCQVSSESSLISRQLSVYVLVFEQDIYGGWCFLRQGVNGQNSRHVSKDNHFFFFYPSPLRALWTDDSSKLRVLACSLPLATHTYELLRVNKMHINTAHARPEF